MFSNLWQRTKNVAATYTWTFIAVMVLNQLLFFGFCLNPICLIAAMPHVLAITVALGSWFNKKNGWGNGEQSEGPVSEPAVRSGRRTPAIDPSSSFSEWRTEWEPTVDRARWIPKRLASEIIQNFPPHENGTSTQKPSTELSRLEKALRSEFEV